MLLVVISPERSVNNESAVVNSLFANGLSRFHIRKPQVTASDYKAYITAIEPQYRSRMVIHGHFELYHEFKLGGIHLNSAARTNELWQHTQNILPAAISTSFHSWQEVEANTFPYAYVFISPVFDSISKAGYKAGIEIAPAKTIKQELGAAQKYCPKIVGLGGVGAEQVSILKKNGFDGAAVLGSIWQVPDPLAAFIKIREVAAD